MDRCGLFIDAGHLLAEAGALCLNTKRRDDIGCDYAEVIKALIDFAEEHSGHSALRVYWYDGPPMPSRSLGIKRSLTSHG